jgi:catechol 2,3-dioxygenase-like lactoylglutathione lyase family enzyme
MWGTVHHAGYVVQTLEPAERHFAALGFERVFAPVDDPDYGATIVFLERRGAAPGEPLIELIRPTSPQSIVGGHARRNELQIHHLCFAVEDIGAALASVRSARMLPVGQVRAAPAIGGSAICFCFSEAMGLFELVERPPFHAGSI